MPTNDQPPEAATLKAAVQGLLYPSESDSPFDVFVWAASADPRAAVAAHTRKRAKLIEQSIDDFFAALKGSDDEPRFQQLRQLLETTLTDLHIFRAGRIRVDVYLLGKSKSANWVGLHTTSVET